MADIFAQAKEEAEKEQQAKRIVQEKEQATYNKKGNAPQNVNSTRSADINWISIPIADIPSYGRFYPENTSIQIRAAKVNEIRHFSTVQENDYLSIDDHLNQILECCCKIYFPNQEQTKNNKNGTTKELLEIDRMFLILAIRDLTFIDAESQLTMQVECPNCGNQENVTISRFDFPKINFDEKIEKYYNSETRKFTFKFRKDEESSEIEELTLRLPTLGITSFVKDYARRKANSNGYIDEGFLKFLLYLDNDYTRLNDKRIKDLDIEMSKWSIRKMSLVTNIIEKLDESMKVSIMHTCSKCGEENEHPIVFQNGYKSLFLSPKPNILDELI